MRSIEELSEKTSAQYSVFPTVRPGMGIMVTNEDPTMETKDHLGINRS